MPTYDIFVEIKESYLFPLEAGSTYDAEKKALDGVFSHVYEPKVVDTNTTVRAREKEAK